MNRSFERISATTKCLITAQKMKFSIKFSADLVTFTEEILNGKLHFFPVNFKVYDVIKWLNKNLKILIV